jgi:GWxTD domain-containing protein
MQKLLFYFLLIGCLASCISTKTNTQTTSDKTATDSVSTKNNSATVTAALSRKMDCLHRVLDNGDSLKVFLELDFGRLVNEKKKSILQTEYEFNYHILQSYTSKEVLESRKIELSEAQIERKNNKFYISFNIVKKTIISAVVLVDIVDIKDPNKKVYDFPVVYTAPKIRDKYALFDAQGDVPYFTDYLLVGDTIQVKDVNAHKMPLKAHYFKHGFNPANPPMATVDKLPVKALQPDSIFQVQTHTPLSFDKKGLYIFYQDSTQYYGLSFVVSDLKYPKLSRVTDVVEPLIYITTGEEMQVLKTTSETKKEFDKLWLKWMSGNVGLAKNLIREYFRRVKYANDYFTTFKEGWKTDKGMIYMIYGGPNRVVRTNDAEHWFYTQTSTFSEIKFSFLKKPNQFTDNHYELYRFPEYEQVWYPIIELWRTGKIQ